MLSVGRGGLATLPLTSQSAGVLGTMRRRLLRPAGGPWRCTRVGARATATDRRVDARVLEGGSAASAQVVLLKRRALVIATVHSFVCRGPCGRLAGPAAGALLVRGGWRRPRRCWRVNRPKTAEEVMARPRYLLEAMG